MQSINFDLTPRCIAVHQSHIRSELRSACAGMEEATASFEWLEFQNDNGPRWDFSLKQSINPERHSSRRQRKFAINLRPLDHVHISDQEFDESFALDLDQEKFHAAETWRDPRKGELFALIDVLLSKKEED